MNGNNLRNWRDSIDDDALLDDAHDDLDACTAQTGERIVAALTVAAILAAVAYVTIGGAV